MESRNIIWGIFFISLTPFLIRGTLAKDDSKPDTSSLNNFLHDHAREVVKFPQLGKFYDISLKSNYSGIKISYIQIRTPSIWTRGINVRAVHIPPKTRILPFVRRLDIVYQDLGNLSSCYYNVPNYRFVTPVIGFATYNGEDNSPSNSSGPPPNICLEGNNTIMIQFPDISVKKKENSTMRCVAFGANGDIQFSNVTVPNKCLARGHGQFSIVVPKSKKSSKKGLAIGLGVGFGILTLLLVILLMCRIARNKELEYMQNEPEKSENLDTAWVGSSKLPAAEWSRNFEIPENDYIP